MDVLHLCHQMAPETRGGVESYVQDLIGAQRAAGQAVAVLTGSHQPWPQVGIETLVLDGVPLHRLHREDLFFDLYSKAWHPGVEAQIEAFLQQHRPRVVHIHQWIRLTTNLVEIVQRQGIAAVVTLHDFYASCPRAFRLRPDGAICLRPVGPASCRDCVPRYGHETAAEIDAGLELFAAESRAELRMADAVLVGVRSTAELVAATLGVPLERFTVLPLGYRRRFPGLGPLPAPEAAGPLRFAFWGGVAPHKGVAVLIEAFRRLCEEPLARPVELHVLGGFSMPQFEQELRTAAAGLPVVFHGRFATASLRDIRPAVGVFPSTCIETFGIVLDECFELGLPCIVSARGALGARAGAGGLRVDPGALEELVAAMRRFVVEPDLWAELRRQLPALPPDLDRHRQCLDEVYAAAIERRAAAGPPAGGVTDAQRAVALRLQREGALARLPMGERH